jgi:hypothetical protein
MAEVDFRRMRNLRGKFGVGKQVRGEAINDHAK